MALQIGKPPPPPRRSAVDSAVVEAQCRRGPSKNLEHDRPADAPEQVANGLVLLGQVVHARQHRVEIEPAQHRGIGRRRIHQTIISSARRYGVIFSLISFA
jgi:hypothetical protein